MPEASSAATAAVQMPAEAEPSTLSEALSALAQSRAETASLRRALADARRRHIEGVAALEALRTVDDVAYVRFASVYKGFAEANDFAKELGMLIKTTAPKLRS
jgi:transcriptional repressor NrdR